MSTDGTFDISGSIDALGPLGEMIDMACQSFSRHMKRSAFAEGLDLHRSYKVDIAVDITVLCDEPDHE